MRDRLSSVVERYIIVGVVGSNPTVYFLFLRTIYNLYNEESDNMNENKTIKIIGLACSVIGFGITLIQKQLDDKKLNDIVAKEVAKQLSETK